MLRLYFKDKTALGGQFLLNHIIYRVINTSRSIFLNKPLS